MWIAQTVPIVRSHIDCLVRCSWCFLWGRRRRKCLSFQLSIAVNGVGLLEWESNKLVLLFGSRQNAQKCLR